MTPETGDGRTAAPRIGLFGGFSMTVHGAPVSAAALPAPTSRMLLAWLGLHSDRLHDRSIVAAVLWPDLDVGDARRRLRHELWQLDRTFEEVEADNPITTTTGSVQLSTGRCEIDVAAFRRLAELPVGEPTSTRRAVAAVERYRGDLLPAVDTGWADLARRELRATYRSLLRQLLSDSVSRGDLETALVWAEREVASDPYDEPGHRRLLRLTALSGRRDLLPDRIAACRQAIEGELGRPLSEETSRLIDRLSSDPAMPAAAPPLATDDPPLIGRERERRELIRSIDRTSGGDGAVVFVVGDEGMGKSRLLQQVAEDARWRGVTVLHVSGGDRPGAAPGASRQPYGGLRAAFDRVPASLRERVAELLGAQEGAAAVALPALDRVTAQRDGSASPDAVRQGAVSAVVHTARVSPTALLVDDPQRLDVETLEVVDAVSAHTSSLPLLLVIAHRPEGATERTAVGRALRSVNRRTVPHRLRLRELERQDASRLVAAVSRVAEPAEVLAGLRARDMGRPSAIVRAAQAPQGDPRRQEEPTPVAADAWRTLAMAPTVPLSAATVASVCGTQEQRVVAALRVLIQRGVVTTHDGERFRCVRAPGVPDTWRPLARALLDELGDRDDVPADVMADLAELAGDLPAQVGFLVESGREALRVQAPGTARERLERAERIAVAAGAPRAERFALLRSLERALADTDASGEQARVIDRLEQLAASDRDRAYVQLRRAELTARSGRFAAALREARQAGELLGGTDDEDLSAAIDATVGELLVRADRASEAVTTLRAAISRYDDPARRVRARVRLGDALRHLRRHAAADEVLEEARRDAVACGDLRSEADACVLLGRIRLERGRVVDAERTLLHAVRVARQVDAGRAEAWAASHLGLLHMEQRRFADALTMFRRGGERAATVGDERAEAFADHRLGELHATWVGDLDRAEEHAGRTLSHFERAGDYRGVAAVHRTFACVAIARGRLDDAWGRLHDGLDLVTTGRAREALAEMMVRLSLVDAHLLVGSVQEARSHLERVDEIRTQRSLRLYTGERADLRARLLTAEGRPDGALEVLDPLLAAAASDASVFRLWFRRARALDAAGDPETAVEAYRRAHDGLERALDGLDDRLVHRSWRDIPAHTEILRSWQSRCPRTVAWEVATREDTARSGGSETVTLEVTVTPPSDTAARRRAVRGLLERARRAGGDPTVRDLADVLGVSASTISRDLSRLRREGYPARTRGT